jgi:predicted acyl esterase
MKWDFPLRDRDHVFRNPQTFTASIYAAKASDFVAATQKVYSTPKMPSRIVLPVIPSGGRKIEQ